MSSRLNGFKDTVFDVAVVGGGIYGTTLAWEAARQGLQVALIEQKDFGHATSASSLKIMHGGLRYLQQLDFVRMRHSIVARRRGFIVAPNLVRPARFMVPTVAFGLQHKLLMTAAFLMNDTISFDRNRGVPEGHEIGMGRVWGYERVRELLAGVADMRVTGGAVWQDGFVENTERFTYAFAHTAETLGAVIANYTKATGLIHDQGHVQGVAIRDEDSGDESEIRARVVINAAGPWLPDLLPPGAEAFHRKTWAWTRGYNIIVRRNLFGEFGVGLEGRADDYDSESVVRRAKRNFFFAPWHGHTLIGTVYKRFDQRPETAGLSSDEIAAFLREVNALYPPAALTLEDVAYTHVGVLPAPYRGGRTDCADPSRDTVVVDYGALKMMNGLYAVRGVKYTTAIDVASKVIRRVAARAGWTLKGAPDAPIYGNEDMAQATEIMATARALHLDVDEHTAGRLAIEYGPHYREVLAIASENASLAKRVTADRPVLGAEVAHAARNEHARHLDDVVLRRTVLGSYGYPGDAAAQTCADILGSETDWSPERKTQEIDALKRAYRQRGLG